MAAAVAVVMVMVMVMVMAMAAETVAAVVPAMAMAGSPTRAGSVPTSWHAQVQADPDLPFLGWLRGRGTSVITRRR